MSQLGNLNTAGSPVAAGGAGGSHRGLRQIAGDFAHRPLAMAGLIVLALALLVSLVAALLINTRIIDRADAFQSPSGSHLLGTDFLGRDELAQLLYGVHSSMLLVGATFALAAVLAAAILGVVRLLGRTRGQEWARWAGVVLTPVVGLLLLGGASLVVSLQFQQSGIEVHPDLFTYIFTTPQTFVFQNPFPFGMEVQGYYLASLLVLFVLAGELVRIVYLLVQRIRGARAPQLRADTTPGTPAWVSIAVPAAAIGLWVAADALLLEALLDNYVGYEQFSPSLGVMFAIAAHFINGASRAPWLVLAPLVALLVLYASLNIVGFGLGGVLRHSPQPEQR
jgi:peptide/nickel transport system permease protein